MWKKLQDFDNYYISNNGKVWSKISKKLLKFTKDKDGYLVIRLRNSDKKTCNLFCHRLVAKHFIENALNLPQVNHLDGNKFNNNDWNLEWCTNKHNQIHKVRMMNTSSKHLYIHYNSIKNKWIAQPTINNKRIYKTFNTEKEAFTYMKEASDELVVNQKFN